MLSCCYRNFRLKNMHFSSLDWFIDGQKAWKNLININLCRLLNSISQKLPGWIPSRSSLTIFFSRKWVFQKIISGKFNLSFLRHYDGKDRCPTAPPLCFLWSDHGCRVHQNSAGAHFSSRYLVALFLHQYLEPMSCYLIFRKRCLTPANVVVLMPLVDWNRCCLVSARTGYFAVCSGVLHMLFW